jgi:hypothetical protein
VKSGRASWPPRRGLPPTLTELDDGHELLASLPAILPRAWDFFAPYLTP